MTVLIDSNIIIRNLKRDDPQHLAARQTLLAYTTNNVKTCIAPQICYEVWVVATRPADQNGLGFDVDQARRVIDALRTMSECYPDPPELLDHWLDLCSETGVKGKRAHDARLVAWMQLHQVHEVLTFNTAHFASFRNIRAIEPNR